METNNPFSQELEVVEHELKLRRARTNYIDYLKLTEPVFKETRLHNYLTSKVQNFIETDTDNAVDILLLSVPPQHGKSMTITETLPSWYLMKNPDHGVIIASYGEDFAVNFGRKNKEKIDAWSEELFPGVEVSDTARSNTDFRIKGRRGSCLSRGLLSGITGNPANLFIIDDPIKNREEAYSETTREKLWGEFLNSVMSRTAANAKIIVIQTRWHEDDLYGRLKNADFATENINIPCEAEEDDDLLGREPGDALCPEIGKGNAWLESFKQFYTSDEGTTAWNALYQGNPTGKSGNIIKPEFWREYSPKDVEALPYKIISVDASFKGNQNSDYVAVQVWGKRDAHYYLLDLFRKRMTFTETLDVIRDFKEKHPDTLYILIEDKANGSAIVDVLEKEMTGIEPVLPKGGKEARVQAVLPTIERGKCHLPKHYGSDYKDFVKECAEFPFGKHDDQVDAMSQALTQMVFVDANVVNEEQLEYKVWTYDMWQDYHNANEELKKELLNIYGRPLNYDYEELEDDEDEDFWTNYEY